MSLRLAAHIGPRVAIKLDLWARALGRHQPQFSTYASFYVQPYLQFASTPDRVCLSGALAGEMMALPPKVRERVDHFFRTHQVWLTKILKRGVARGEFKLPAPAPKVARFVFGALQGALLVKRTTNDLSQINDVIAVMKLQLAAH
jgi:TetR/AcrR family transcriptional repressor of nem operon